MSGLLDGLRVLDLSLWQPGHYATQLLADLGADVLKVEPPGGDRMRQLPDRFVNYNAHKRSVVLDLKGEEDRAGFLELAAEAEVVVENNRPGVLDRLGIGHDVLRAVNPAVVLCSISGFGQTGPLAGATGHDANYQAYAGAFTRDAAGDVHEAGLLVGDQGSGLAAAFAILAAVLRARRTGEGDHVDVSIADLLATWVAPMGPIDPDRVAAGDPMGGPRPPAMGAFPTADGEHVEIGVFSEDHFWDELCRALGLEHAVGLTMAERAAATERLRGELAAAVASRGRDELVATLAPRGVPIAPVLRREEMLQHPHFRAREVVTTGPDGDRRVGHPIRYVYHPALPPGRAPALDEHHGGGFGRDQRRRD